MEREINGDTVNIVIPVYNVEKYLPKCIDSAINQTYGNLRIILVDDGSADRSPEICDEYAKRDERICVIHKENGGVSDARNAGLEYIRQNSIGGYIYFIDADDYINENLLEKCVGLIKDYNCDVIVLNAVYENEDGTPIYYQKFKPALYIQDTPAKRYKNISTVVMNYKRSGWGTSNRFYKADHIIENKLLFSKNIKIGEDLLFTMKATVYQEKIKVIKDVLYHYVNRADSAMNGRGTIDFDKVVELCRDFKEFSIICAYEDIINSEEAFIFSGILFDEIVKLDGDLKQKTELFERSFREAKNLEFAKEIFMAAQRQKKYLFARRGLLDALRILLIADGLQGKPWNRNIIYKLHRVWRKLVSGRKS